jgi:hypothetical protein
MYKNVRVYSFLLQKKSFIYNHREEQILKVTGIKSAEENIWNSKETCTNIVIKIV